MRAKISIFFTIRYVRSTDLFNIMFIKRYVFFVSIIPINIIAIGKECDETFWNKLWCVSSSWWFNSYVHRVFLIGRCVRWLHYAEDAQRFCEESKWWLVIMLCFNTILKSLQCVFGLCLVEFLMIRWFTQKLLMSPNEIFWAFVTNSFPTRLSSI